MKTAIPLPLDELRAFCERRKIARLEVFGSILRDDFTDASDIDFLATWAPEARIGYSAFVEAEEELSALVGRRVDLLSRSAVEMSENDIRRNAILSGTQVVYAA